ncbi:MAG: sugar ABC transporter permease [Elusimicrobiaceae bacterium]|nr:sugar ABC transporter permease [Elusimicrobiaceae bacterium]
MNPLLASILEVLQMVLFVAWTAFLMELYLWFHFKKYRESWFVPAMLAGTPALACLLVLSAVGNAVSLRSLAVIAGAAFAAEIPLLYMFKAHVRGKWALPFMLILPGFAGLALLIAYPLAFEIYLAFFDLKLTTLKTWSQTGTLPFVGLQYFRQVFTLSPLSEITFWQLLWRTLWWTFINVFFHVLGGFALALLLNNNIKLKGVYRTLLIVPWAMPQVVAVLAMRGEFLQNGFVNEMLRRLAEWSPLLAGLGLGPVQWLSNHAFLTCTLINVWLGIPFMMVVILGGLQSIPSSYYDAASIDGASAFQKFRNITLPLLRPVIAPAVTLGTVWTFNNINVIYLVTGQAGGTEDADILVSALYKAAFTFNRYSYSAAFAIVIFILLFAISMLWLKFSRGTDSVYE